MGEDDGVEGGLDCTTHVYGIATISRLNVYDSHPNQRNACNDSRHSLGILGILIGNNARLNGIILVLHFQEICQVSM